MARKTRVKVFDDLRQSLADAGAYEQGKPVTLRTKEIPPLRFTANSRQEPCGSCWNGQAFTGKN